MAKLQPHLRCLTLSGRPAPTPLKTRTRSNVKQGVRGVQRRVGTDRSMSVYDDVQGRVGMDLLMSVFDDVQWRVGTDLLMSVYDDVQGRVGTDLLMSVFDDVQWRVGTDLLTVSYTHLRAHETA